MVRYASTFLAHSSKQGTLVAAVGRELLRRGVLAWIDAEQPLVGVDLTGKLREAAAAQVTLTAFLSEDALASSWFTEELEPRLRATPTGEDDAVVPVYLGDPRELVRRSQLLVERWMTADGTRVDRHGVRADDEASREASSIARHLAEDLFRRRDTKDAPRVILVLDQRGGGRRAGYPSLDLVPANWESTDWPALVFRPDAGERTPNEVLHGAAWTEVRDALRGAMSDALGTHTRREIFISGNAQLALAWLLGTQVDRSTLARLRIRNARTSEMISLDQGEPRFRTPLEPVPESEIAWCTPRAGATSSSISVALMPDNYLGAVHAFRSQSNDSSPLAFRRTGSLEGAEDVVELARWLGTVAGQRDVKMYTALPFQAVVALAALSKHLVGRLAMLERDSGANTYRECAM